MPASPLFFPNSCEIKSTIATLKLRSRERKGEMRHMKHTHPQHKAFIKILVLKVMFLIGLIFFVFTLAKTFKV